MAESMAARIAALQSLPLKELREQYQQLFGCREDPSFKRDFLWRRIAFRIQEQAFGGLSDPARERLHALQDSPDLGKGLDPTRRAPRAGERYGDGRDRRLPMPGTLLRRTYKGQALEVKVLDRAFEYQGRSFTSLTALAGEITGSHWNGFLFFHLA